MNTYQAHQILQTPENIAHEIMVTGKLENCKEFKWMDIWLRVSDEGEVRSMSRRMYEDAEDWKQMKI